MQHITIQHNSDATPEEVAAVLAAVSLVLTEENRAVAVAPEGVQSDWVAAARLTTQGLAPFRIPATVRWNTIERIRRAGRGGSGIV